MFLNLVDGILINLPFTLAREVPLKLEVLQKNP